MSARREGIHATLAAAEACWLAPVFVALQAVVEPHQPLFLWLGLLVFLLGFAYLYRALVAAELPLRAQQGFSALALIVAIALFLRYHVYGAAQWRGAGWFLGLLHSLTDVSVSAPAGWVAIMALVFFWMRAIHLARRSLSAESVGFSFRAGVIILIVVSLAAHLFAGADVSGFVVAYFFFSLMAVALARIEQVSQLPNSTPVRFGGFWIGNTVAAVAVLVLLGMGIAFFFYGGGLHQVLVWLGPVYYLFQLLVAGLGALLIVLIEGVLSLFSLDISLLGEGLREALQRLGELVPPVPSPPPPTADTRPAILGALQVGFAIGIPVLVVVLVLLWTWQRQRRAGREGRDGEYESLLSAAALARNLRASLRSGLDRLGALAGAARRYGLGARFLAAVSIRRIYANMVRLATDAGYPRARSETPYEYLATLRRALPGSEADVQVITEAYVNAHYGQVPDTREELQRIRDCWQRVRAEGAERRKEAS